MKKINPKINGLPRNVGFSPPSIQPEEGCAPGSCGPRWQRLFHFHHAKSFLLPGPKACNKYSFSSVVENSFHGPA